MKKIFATLAFATALTAVAQVPYRVISPMGGLEEGTWVYLTNYDDGSVVDSVQVSQEGAAVFTGDIDEPIVVRMTANGQRFGSFILEQGTTAINEKSRNASGTMLNDQLNSILAELGNIGSDLGDNPSEEAYNAAYNQFLTAMRQAILDNNDSPVGYMLFLEYANIVDPNEMLALLEQCPDLKAYKRVQGIVNQAAVKLATMPGNKFVDFEVTYDGVTKRLSDHVGKGHYTLVDFWASWCGPCMREIKTIKEIYNEYKDQGLEVLGVAVWDTPEDTKGAIDRMQIPWECIIDAQTIPTDLYGIAGIPCIILFGPDGTIISRDLQGDQLKAAVAAALSK